MGPFILSADGDNVSLRFGKPDNKFRASAGNMVHEFILTPKEVSKLISELKPYRKGAAKPFTTR